MMTYFFLVCAIGFEVFATMLLPVSNHFTNPLPTVFIIVSYGLSFYFLSIVSQTLPLSIIYASWAGMGIFLIALLSFVFYKQALNWQMIIGLCLIIVGVVMVHAYNH